MDELESPETRERVGRWMEEGQYLLGRLFPTLIEQRDRLKARAEAAEQACEKLRTDLGELQGALQQLRHENQALRNEQAELGQVFATLTERLRQILDAISAAHQRFPLTHPKQQ